MPNLLLVEPNARFAARIRNAVQTVSHVDTQRKFESAKKRLAERPYDFVVTNLRLVDYNGLHLVYLAATHPAPPRCIVYTKERDPWIAREVQHAKAFYDIAECLPVTLLAYMTSTLPPADRRDAAQPDRRSGARGGRRCWDRHVQQASA